MKVLILLLLSAVACLAMPDINGHGRPIDNLEEDFYFEEDETIHPTTRKPVKAVTKKVAKKEDFEEYETIYTTTKKPVKAAPKQVLKKKEDIVAKIEEEIAPIPIPVEEVAEFKEQTTQKPKRRKQRRNKPKRKMRKQENIEEHEAVPCAKEAEDRKSQAKSSPVPRKIEIAGAIPVPTQSQIVNAQPEPIKEKKEEVVQTPKPTAAPTTEKILQSEVVTEKPKPSKKVVKVVITKKPVTVTEKNVPQTTSATEVTEAAKPRTRIGPQYRRKPVRKQTTTRVPESLDKEEATTTKPKPTRKYVRKQPVRYRKKPQVQEAKETVSDQTTVADANPSEVDAQPRRTIRKRPTTTTTEKSVNEEEEEVKQARRNLPRHRFYAGHKSNRAKRAVIAPRPLNSFLVKHAKPLPAPAAAIPEELEKKSRKLEWPDEYSDELYEEYDEDPIPELTTPKYTISRSRVSNKAITPTNKPTVKSKKQHNYVPNEYEQEQNRAAHYEFESNVDDGISDLTQQRSEVRDGLSVKGSYSYSDGYFNRTVHYEADENGYRVVRTDVEPLDGPQIDLNGSASVSNDAHGKHVTYRVQSVPVEGPKARIIN